MTPHVREYICPKEVNLFRKRRFVIEKMDEPDLGKGNILSCHILTRAVSEIFLVEVEDGFFLETYQHSWLRTKKGNIIDVYPVACLGGPILYDGGVASPARRIYKKAPILGQDFSCFSFKEKVRITTEVLWNTIERYRKGIGMPI